VSGLVESPAGPSSLGPAVTQLHRISVWHLVGLGAVFGVTWGAVLRGWMRFITTSPEFSWSGTLLIVVGSGIVGAMLGFARHRRNVGGIGWWRVNVLFLLLLGGAGSVMWPSVILGGIAFARPRPRWLRIGTAVLATVIQIPLVSEVAVQNPLFTPAEVVVAIAWYVVMLTIEAWAFSVVFARAVEGAAKPATWKKVGIALPFVALAGMSVVMMGLIG
jgi:hypothetical protein